jgi:hypothetical protein
VIGPKPRVGDVAEHVLGEQRRSQRKERDRGDDRSPEHATRQRGRGGDDQDVADERHDEEGEEACAVDPKSVSVRTEQPPGLASDGGGYESGSRQRKRNRAEDEDRSGDKRDCAPSM